MSHSDDPEDFKSITPGHFLNGKPLTAPIDENLVEIPENKFSR